MVDPQRRPPVPPSPSTGSRDAARRIFEREGGESQEAHHVLAGADRICARVCVGLTRWFGPFGAAALMSRALARAQVEHPVLAPAAVLSDKSPCVTGLIDGVQPGEARLLSEGVIVLLATLTDLIGRLIGDDLALRLLDQSAAAPMAGESANTPPDAAAAGSISQAEPIK